MDDCCKMEGGKNKGHAEGSGVHGNFLVYAMLGVTVLVLGFSLVQSMKIADLTNSVNSGQYALAPASGVSSSGGGGESYEAMMARMHPDQVKPNAPASQGGAPAQVGGC